MTSSAKSDSDYEDEFNNLMSRKRPPNVIGEFFKLHKNFHNMLLPEPTNSDDAAIEMLTKYLENDKTFIDDIRSIANCPSFDGTNRYPVQLNPVNIEAFRYVMTPQVFLILSWCKHSTANDIDTLLILIKLAQSKCSMFEITIIDKNAIMNHNNREHKKETEEVFRGSYGKLMILHSDLGLLFIQKYNDLLEGRTAAVSLLQRAKILLERLLKGGDGGKSRRNKKSVKRRNKKNKKSKKTLRNKRNSFF